MSTGTRTLDTFWVLSSEIVGVLAQIALMIIGARFMLIDSDDEFSEIARLLLWCVVGTLFLLGTVFWLNVDLRIRSRDHDLLRRLSGGPLIRWISTLFSFSTSLVGFSAAITLILLRSEAESEPLYELAAVWAMLVSWAMFHWGYARVYHSRYARTADPKPLQFPGTAEPRLTDFAYFAFTNGTSFAPSDVIVTDSRMRWTVVWHTTFSFFFNALIIVLSMNTIAGGFADL